MAKLKTADTSSQADLSDEERQRSVFWNPFVVFKEDGLETYMARLSGSSRSASPAARLVSNQRDQNRLPSATLNKIFSRKLSDILGREINLESSLDLNSNLKSEEQSAIKVDEYKNAEKFEETGIQRGIQMRSISSLFNSAKDKSKLSTYINSLPNSWLPSIAGLQQGSRYSYLTNALENEQTKVPPGTKTMNETSSGVLKFNRKFNLKEESTVGNNTPDDKCRVVYKNDFIVNSAGERKRNLNGSASPVESWEQSLWDYESLCERSQQSSRVSTDRLLSSLDSYDMPSELRLPSLLTQILYPQEDSSYDVTSGCSLKRNKSDSRKLFGWESENNSATDDRISRMDSVRFAGESRHPREIQQRPKNFWEKKSNTSESTQTNDGDRDLVIVVTEKDLEPGASREVLKENNTESEASAEHTFNLLNADPRAGLNSCVMTPTHSKDPHDEPQYSRSIPREIPHLSPSKDSKSRLDYISDMSLKQRIKAHSAASQKSRRSNKSAKVGFNLINPQHRMKRNSAPTPSLANGDGYDSRQSPITRRVFKKVDKSRLKSSRGGARRQSPKLRLSKQVVKVIQMLLEQIEELEELLNRLRGREEDFRVEMEALRRTYEDSWRIYLRSVSEYSSLAVTDTSDFSSALRFLLDAGMQLNNNKTGHRRIIL